MSRTQLSIEGLTKSYGSTEVLRNISFDVADGRFVVLLGPSGSGKSTLLRCLSGVERAQAGRIRLGDTVLADAGGRQHIPPERRELAMVFQDYALWPHMTAAVNVGYALRRRRPGRTAGAARVREMLDRVGLAHRADHYPHQLSGGEQQRVALARALVAAPRLLLFDEPLSNLDADLRERLRVEISTLTRESGATAVYITHDQAEAFALADEIGVLQGGRLVQYARPEDVYHRPNSPFVARFTGLSGEVAGVVEDEPAPGKVRVRLAGGAVDAVAFEPLAPRAVVAVLIRPAATALRPATDINGLPVLIRDVAYRGRGYDHVVELSCGTRLVGVFDTRPWPRESTARLHLDSEGCFAYPSGPDGVTAPPGAGSSAPSHEPLEVA